MSMSYTLRIYVVYIHTQTHIHTYTHTSEYICGVGLMFACIYTPHTHTHSSQKFDHVKIR